MQGIYLCDDELWALSTCSGTAVKAYLRLRARMDINTRVVGVRSGISYQMVREWSAETIEKGSGEVEEMPTYKQARTALAQLVRRGLLRRMGGEKLVFCCVLASTPEIRPKRRGHVQGRGLGGEQGRVEGTNGAGAAATEYAGFDDVEGCEQGTELGRVPAGPKVPNGAHIGEGVNPYTHQAAYTEVDSVGPSSVVEFAAAVAGRSMANDTAMSDEQRGQYTELYRCLRQAGAKVSALDRDRLQQWVQQKVTLVQLTAAVQLAKRRREAEGSRQPIGVAYLDAIIADIRKPKCPPWWSSDAAMEAKAREVGIDGARIGESREQFKARITVAIRSTECAQG